jgi:hypothetical protein
MHPEIDPSMTRTALPVLYELNAASESPDGCLRSAVSTNRASTQEVTVLLQIRVFRLDVFQNWDLRIGILPELQEIVVCKFGVRPISSHGVGPHELRAVGNPEVSDEIASR